MQPPRSNQPQWTRRRNIRAEIDLDVMIARHALVLPAPERIQILSIDGAQRLGNIISVIVNRARDSVWAFDRSHSKLYRRNCKAFVREYLCAYRMIDGHQMQRIVVVRLPQLA